MPLFFKDNGVWKNVDAPYIKQDGKWILPEQIYIKEDGQWKLIFEEFTFVVETVGSTEVSDKTVLEGQLTDFEDFGTKETFFFDQTLPEAASVEASAIDERRKLLAIGGGDDTVFVYNIDFSIDRTSSNLTPSRIENVDDIQQPTGTINGLDFHEDEEVLAVASNKLFLYDDEFLNVNTFSSDEGEPFTDVQFNSNTGTVAAGIDGGFAYIYELQNGNWSFNQKIAVSGNVTSVSWRDSDSFLAVGNNQGKVEIFDSGLNLDTEITNFVGNTAVEFSSNGRLAVVDEENVKVYTNNFNLTSTLTEGTEGNVGDVAWDDSELLAHASTDNRVYVYNGSNFSFDLVKSFDDASRQFTTVAWDGSNEYIAVGTSESGSGDAHIFSTGAQMFFDWGEDGDGFPNRKRASGLRRLDSFETGLGNLDRDTQYEFRAGGFASDGRTVIDSNSLSFMTVDLEVQTDPPSNIQSTSTTFKGSITTFNRDKNEIDENPVGSFEWGKQNEGFRNITKVGPISLPSGDFNKNIEGLETGTDYKYRAKAEFGGVTDFGTEETFTTKNVTAALSSGTADPTNFDNTFIDSQTSPTTDTKTITVEETSGTGSYFVESATEIVGQNTQDFKIDQSLTFPLEVQAGSSRDIDVIFEPTQQGDLTADIDIFHDAATGPDPLSVTLQGTGERITALAASGTSLNAVIDGNQNTTTVTITETGGDYSGTITSIGQDGNQPSGTQTSEWDIFNRPGNLSSGGDATINAGGTVTFDVGWNPDASDPQDYNIVVTYNGSGISDGTELNITVNGTVSGEITANVDPERNGTTTTTSYTFEDTFIEDSRQDTVIDFSVVGDVNGDYEITEIYTDPNTGNPSDFIIQNAPTAVRDSDGTTGETVSTGDDLLFQIKFDPSQEGQRVADLILEGNSAVNLPLTINLSGEGLKSSEINVLESEPVDFGTAIAGGNVSGEEATSNITVQNLSDDENFDVISDTISQSVSDNDFDIGTSLAGQTIGPDALATLEFAPRATNGYSDNSNPDGNPKYEISHNAQFGNNPFPVDLTGTVQVTTLEYSESGTTFDPSTTNVIISGSPGETNTKNISIAVPSSGNEVSTFVSVTNPTSESDVLSLSQDPTEGEVSPGGSALTATAEFSPTGQEDDGETENVTVSWDNNNESQTVTFEGAISSTIDVITADASDATTSDNKDSTLDFGEVTENTSETLDIVVEEVGGNFDFDITTLGSLSGNNSDTYNINSNFGGSAPVTVSAGTSVSSTIEIAPATGEGGSTQDDTFTFEHDADTETDSFETSPVDINLTGVVLNKATIEVVQSSDSSSTINYEAEIGGDGKTDIDISETGNDNDLTVDSFEVTGDGQGSFSLNTDNSTDYTNYNSTISAGQTITDVPVEFEPDSSTGSSPDYIVQGELSVSYSGNGVINSPKTVTLEGEVIRPAKADISSSTSNPLQFIGSGGGATYYEENIGLSFSKKETYTVVEENNKNSYQITALSVNGNNSGKFVNVTSTTDGDPILDPNSSNVTVSAGGSETGTVEFNSNSPGYYDDTYLLLNHDAPEEGNQETSGLSDSSSVALEFFIEIVGNISADNTNAAYSKDFGFTSPAPNRINYSISAENIPLNAGNFRVRVTSSTASVDNLSVSSSNVSSVGSDSSDNEDEGKFDNDFSGNTNITVQFDTDDTNATFDLFMYKIDPDGTEGETLYKSGTN